MAVATLPVTLVTREEYEDQIEEAKKRIGQRDPDDAELLALALKRKVPVWSNDNDFEVAGVEWFTSARLLAWLEAAKNS